ncbi:hypothetical protein AJ78_05138 [Emergomyces pasteurianus Ep9510]|uniref:Uncharacterized protein n=1 Tax=Emergomyces pasteurianus Ep9510 TaxID=1447872 RepID=A0A1J9QF06_9EURO|nr:hypothetical protein AJ78_05138 [Emergomyces pasteurianus Ep9510]
MRQNGLKFLARRYDFGKLCLLALLEVTTKEEPKAAKFGSFQVAGVHPYQSESNIGEDREAFEDAHEPGKQGGLPSVHPAEVPLFGRQAIYAYFFCL